MDIVAVDRYLQLAAVDENESEAVAISCVEFVLSETNVYYHQKCLAQKLCQSVSSQFQDDVFGAVFAAATQAEQVVDITRLQPEQPPEPTGTDRYAVRSLPLKSFEKRMSMLPKTASLPPSRVESSPEKLRSRPRKKKDDFGEGKKGVETVQREELDAENPEIKEWRDKCLKSLKSSTRKTGFAKWATIARAFIVPETRVSMDVGVITAPSSKIMEALVATPVRMKTNVDSFSSIIDMSNHERLSTLSATRRESRRTSSYVVAATSNAKSVAANFHRKTERRQSQSASASDFTHHQPRRSIVLNDSLSGSESIRQLSIVNSFTGHCTTSRNDDQRTESTTDRAFVAAEPNFNASAFAATMSVASGVTFSQGDSVIAGPKWIDGPTTMSRKRFNLQHGLAADTLFQTPLVDAPPHLGHDTAISLAKHGSREYEEVATEPTSIRQLSPIVPKSHFKTSLSTPILRVRSPKSSLKGRSHRSAWTTSSDPKGRSSVATPDTRPMTGLGAITSPRKLIPGLAMATPAGTAIKSKGTALTSYLREFPKPNPGIIHVVNNQAAVLLERQSNA